VRAWIPGGWGVNALVGEQSRSHDDLDLAIDPATKPTPSRPPAGRVPDCRRSSSYPVRSCEPHRDPSRPAPSRLHRPGSPATRAVAFNRLAGPLPPRATRRRTRTTTTCGCSATGWGAPSRRQTEPLRPTFAPIGGTRLGGVPAWEGGQRRPLPSMLGWRLVPGSRAGWPRVCWRCQSLPASVRPGAAPGGLLRLRGRLRWAGARLNPVRVALADK
jgi:hypothetical protein